MGNCCVNRNYKDGKLHSYDDRPIYTIYSRIWYKEGIIHRDIGPARISHNGAECHYENGKLRSSNDIPAVTHPNGSEVYIMNDKIHRDNDKPAVILVKHKYSCMRGSCGVLNLSTSDDEITLSHYLFEDIKHENFNFHNLHNITYSDDYVTITKYWFNNGVLHRDNGPAIESDLCLIWVNNGKIHRDNDPAVICSDGTCEYWQNGSKVTGINQYKTNNSVTKSANKI